ncbi:hypothetical protein BB560_003368 [Smittium megazygosporum]|uniref:Uncharacterized protein n=1 Tax=Smittium megazygosporum TaxID=133381 RepID=A0A2T9ZC81_9FUNG|nr:hypothetical protein BB560_003368 [Smittium megazygosporum]
MGRELLYKLHGASDGNIPYDISTETLNLDVGNQGYQSNKLEGSIMYLKYGTIPKNYTFQNRLESESITTLSNCTSTNSIELKTRNDLSFGKNESRSIVSLEGRESGAISGTEGTQSIISSHKNVHRGSSVREVPKGSSSSLEFDTESILDYYTVPRFPKQGENINIMRVYRTIKDSRTEISISTTSHEYYQTVDLGNNGESSEENSIEHEDRILKAREEKIKAIFGPEFVSNKVMVNVKKENKTNIISALSSKIFSKLGFTSSRSSKASVSFCTPNSSKDSKAIETIPKKSYLKNGTAQLQTKRNWINVENLYSRLKVIWTDSIPPIIKPEPYNVDKIENNTRNRVKPGSKNESSILYPFENQLSADSIHFDNLNIQDSTNSNITFKGIFGSKKTKKSYVDDTGKKRGSKIHHVKSTIGFQTKKMRKFFGGSYSTNGDKDKKGTVLGKDWEPQKPVLCNPWLDEKNSFSFSYSTISTISSILSRVSGRNKIVTENNNKSYIMDMVGPDIAKNITQIVSEKLETILNKEQNFLDEFNKDKTLNLQKREVIENNVSNGAHINACVPEEFDALIRLPRGNPRGQMTIGGDRISMEEPEWNDLYLTQNPTSVINETVINERSETRDIYLPNKGVLETESTSMKNLGVLKNTTFVRNRVFRAVSSPIDVTDREYTDAVTRFICERYSNRNTIYFGTYVAYKKVLDEDV